MKKRFLVFVVILWGASAWGKLSPLICSPRSLAIKNCHIHRGDLKIHLRDDKLNIFNGVHRHIEVLPVAGERIFWEKVRLRPFRQKLFVELELWGPPDDSTGVSELHWLVYGIEGVKAQLSVHKIVQRRKKVEGRGKGPTYEKEKSVSHSLQWKNGRVYWSHGFDEGKL